MFWALRSLLALTALVPVWAQVDCAGCHDHATRVSQSAHASLKCASCHEGVGEFPHAAPVKKAACASCHASESQEFSLGAHGLAAARGNPKAPACAACHADVHETKRAETSDYRAQVATMCGTCHAEITQQYNTSVHGQEIAKGNLKSATCTSCHGPHTNASFRGTEAAVAAVQIRDACASCDSKVRLASENRLQLDRVASFDQSFHGLAGRAGSPTVANCASCHGVHNILPSSDPKSTIHASNLQHTCGQCHPGASAQFASAKTHWLEGEQEPAGVLWIRRVYLVLIPLVVGLMFLHNFGDFARKWMALVRRKAALEDLPPAGEVRMHRMERWQHAILIVSFVLLVWTGFALRYPDFWLSQPLVAWEKHFPVRGTLHRVGAVLITVLSVAHIVSLWRSHRLRQHWRKLWPSVSDIGEAWRSFLYAVGLSSHKPAVAAHSYVAKAEYWSVVWGTAVMAITGFLLWANRYTFAWFPREWLDAAAALHFYEAVLASLAIVVWHFYTVIFDPEVYPVDSAWLNGISSRRRLRKVSKPAEVPAAGD